MRVRGRIRRPLVTVGAALAVWLIVGRIHLSRLLRRVRPGERRIGAAGIEERIRRELLSWPGVTVAPHRYGGIEFRLGKRELGHLHGDYLADLPFPIRLREELVAQGRAMPHHILPPSGLGCAPCSEPAAGRPPVVTRSGLALHLHPPKYSHATIAALVVIPVTTFRAIKPAFLV